MDDDPKLDDLRKLIQQQAHEIVAFCHKHEIGPTDAIDALKENLVAYCFATGLSWQQISDYFQFIGLSLSAMGAETPPAVVH